MHGFITISFERSSDDMSNFILVLNIATVLFDFVVRAFASLLSRVGIA